MVKARLLQPVDDLVPNVFRRPLGVVSAIQRGHASGVGHRRREYVDLRGQRLVRVPPVKCVADARRIVGLGQRRAEAGGDRSHIRAVVAVKENGADLAIIVQIKVDRLVGDQHAHHTRRRDEAGDDFVLRVIRLNQIVGDARTGDVRITGFVLGVGVCRHILEEVANDIVGGGCSIRHRNGVACANGKCVRGIISVISRQCAGLRSFDGDRRLHRGKPGDRRRSDGRRVTLGLQLNRFRRRGGGRTGAIGLNVVYRDADFFHLIIGGGIGDCITVTSGNRPYPRVPAGEFKLIIVAGRGERGRFRRNRRSTLRHKLLCQQGIGSVGVPEFHGMISGHRRCFANRGAVIGKSERQRRG